MIDLKHYLANEASKQYAKVSGLTIDELIEKDPLSFKILNSAAIIEVDKRLEQEVLAIFSASFRDREIFRRLTDDGLSQLMVFPPLETDDLAKFHASLDLLLQSKAHQKQHIYYRLISDTKGEHHQLAYPLTPSRWSGQTNWLVGPFISDDKAKAWIKNNLETHAHLDNDIIMHNHKIFVDVFSNQL